MILTFEYQTLATFDNQPFPGDEMHTGLSFHGSVEFGGNYLSPINLILSETNETQNMKVVIFMLITGGFSPFYSRNQYKMQVNHIFGFSPNIPGLKLFEFF